MDFTNDDEYIPQPLKVGHNKSSNSSHDEYQYGNTPNSGPIRKLRFKDISSAKELKSTEVSSQTSLRNHKSAENQRKIIRRCNKSINDLNQIVSKKSEFPLDMLLPESFELGSRRQNCRMPY